MTEVATSPPPKWKRPRIGNGHHFGRDRSGGGRSRVFRVFRVRELAGRSGSSSETPPLNPPKPKYEGRSGNGQLKLPINYKAEFWVNVLRLITLDYVLRKGAQSNWSGKQARICVLCDAFCPTHSAATSQRHAPAPRQRCIFLKTNSHSDSRRPARERRASGHRR